MEISEIDKESNFSNIMRKGISFDSLGSFNEALSCFDEAAKELKDFKDDTQKIAAEFLLACNRGNTYRNLRNYDASLSQYDKALELAEKIPQGYRYLLTSHNLEKTTVYLGKVKTLAAIGEINQSIELCRDILLSQPENHLAISMMGCLFLRAERYQEAIYWCTRALETDNLDIHSLANLGAAFLGVGKIEEGRSALQQALDLAPTHSHALYSMGTLLLQSNSPEQSIDYLRAAVSSKPRYSEAWNHLGIALFQANKPGWEECFIQALRSNPNNHQALANFTGIIRQKQGCCPEEALSSALISAGICESKLQVAQILINNGSYSEALTLFNNVRIDNVGISEARLGKATCMHRLGSSNEAIRVLEDLAREEPGNFMAFHNLGAILAEMGKIKESVFYYKRALEIDDQHAETWLGLATVTYQSDSCNLLKEALDYLNQALSLQPDLAQAYGIRGRILNDLDRTTEALESYNRALALSPGTLGDMFGRGLVLVKLGNHIEAAETFEEVYKLDPSSTSAIANQVISLALAGQIERACIVLQQKLQVHTNNQDLILASAQLRKIIDNEEILR